MRSLPERVYGVLMLSLAALLLGLYLACVIEGVLTLCLYENASGLGLMAVGGVLYAGGRLALEEGREVLT